MKKTSWIMGLALFGSAAIGSDFPNTAQHMQPDIVVSRYGYWRFQPLKMAYAALFIDDEIPAVFTIHSLSGSCVFSGKPVLMQTPWKVFTPANRYRGEKIYALDFSAFNRSGQYFIRIKGMQDSPVFTIRGPLPVPASSLPDASVFDAAAGIFPMETNHQGQKP